VLVQRTLYGRGLEQSTFVSLNPRQLAEAGFAVVVQDTRGRGDSDGEFDPSTRPMMVMTPCNGLLRSLGQTAAPPDVGTV
jgi:hypothetical protein